MDLIIEDSNRDMQSNANKYSTLELGEEEKGVYK